MASQRAIPCIFILALAILLGLSLGHGQSLKLGLHARVFRLIGTDEHNAFTEPVSEGGYGFGPWAPSLDFEVRYSPFRGIITFAGDVSYTPFSGTGTTRYIDETGAPIGEREYEAQLYIASFGAQFKMLQGSTRPYLGARMQWSFLSKVTVKYPGEEKSMIPPGYGGSVVYFGIGLLGGVEVDLDSSWSLDIATRYNFTNVENPTQPAYGNVLSIGIGIFYEIL